MTNRPPTTSEMIKERIGRLHNGGGGDWKTLKDQVDEHYRTIPYNAAQQIAILSTAMLKTVKELDLEWGRGTGKTTVFARYSRVIASEMPRGSFQWIVPTYQKFLTEIIPAYIHALEMQGLYKDLHYFIGRRPPAKWKWPEPYKPPLRYDNFITFYTGFGFHLLSQDISGSGRGLSTDGEFADEVVMLDPKKMDENSSPSIRGSNYRVLGSNRWFDFRIKASSTALTPAGSWFTDREELAQMDDGKRHLFLKANCICNMANLKPDYLEVARKSALDLEIFNAEYLNIRPRFVRGGFYAMLEETRHCYTNYNYSFYTPDAVGIKATCQGDSDLTPGEKLLIGMDFGAAINSITVSQQYPGEFRTLKEFFGKGAEGKTQDDVCEEFHQYYLPHQASNPHILFFYDATGNSATGNTKLNRAQQVEQYLSARGWKVRRMTVSGTNPHHFQKYLLWERIFNEQDPRFPRFRINKQNARFTYLSMSRARSKKRPDNTIGKDKREERSDNPNRQLATDLSDALDNPVYVLYAHLMRDYGPALPDSNMSGI